MRNYAVFYLQEGELLQSGLPESALEAAQEQLQHLLCTGSAQNRNINGAAKCANDTPRRVGYRQPSPAD
jgi:hypothetical protein